MLDFGMVPPEVTSAKMYSGPGAGSLLAAATAWNALSAELQSTAESYGSVIASLTSLEWLGPASVSMAAAATPYTQWLATTAARAQQTANQALAAAAAFEQAFAMTVPPPVIAANRTLLHALIATNFFGQNTPAIAATEAAYTEMWAQDTTAMNSYAATSAAAATLTPFTSPHHSTNPAGNAAQHAAVTQAGTKAAANSALNLPTSLSQLSSLTSSVLFNFTSGDGVLVPEDFTLLDEMFAVYATVGVTQDVQSLASGVISTQSTLGVLPAAIPVADTMPGGLAGGLAPAAGSLSTLAGAVSAGGLSPGAGLGGVSAAFRSAGSIGQMSVPASWAAPTATNVTTLSHTPLATLPTDEPLRAAGHGMPGMPGMPMPGTGRGGGIVPRYGARLTVMSRPLSGG